MIGISFKKVDFNALPEQSKKYTGYIYLLQHNGLTKIGRTSNPYKRIRNLIDASNLGNIEICISDLHDRFRENEIAMHKIYQEFRVKGEWFNLTLDKFENHYPDLKMNVTDSDRKVTPTDKAMVFQSKSLRDKFAMAALAGVVVDYESNRSIENSAFFAYKMADEMLKARLK